MPAPIAQHSLLDLQTDLWKSRAVAKQKWLERTLAEPPRTHQDVTLRNTWISEALHAVKRAHLELKYQLALLDVYDAHLSALEMSLMSADHDSNNRREVPDDVL